jgi:hypothetical protein
MAALAFVVILAFAGLAVDLSLLRNNRQTLVNTLDAAALAGGVLLPVDGSVAANVTNANTLINTTIQANYPGLPTSSTAAGSRCVAGVDANIGSCAYTIAYKCLVGVDPITNSPLISRDVPAACDPRSSMSLGTTLPPASAFTGAGPTRTSSCNPSAGDKCNVVVITGSATTKFSFGPVVGVNSGSTGAVVSVACNGPCGNSPVIPVDLVIILDRTASMAGSSGGQGGPLGLRSLEAARRPGPDRSQQRRRCGQPRGELVWLGHGLRRGGRHQLHPAHVPIREDHDHHKPDHDPSPRHAVQRPPAVERQLQHHGRF